MKVWADFLNEVMPELPGANSSLVEDRIKLAAIQFFNMTHVYKIDLPAIDSIANVGSYLMPTGITGTEVCHIFDVWYDGDRITAKSGDYLAEKYDYWPEETGDPVHYVEERTDTLIVVPMPEVVLTGAIVAKVAIRPTLDAVDIPDHLFSEHHEAIAHGALFRMMRMAKKPWTDVNMASSYGQSFQAAIDAARHKQQAGNVRSLHHVANGRSRFL